MVKAIPDFGGSDKMSTLLLQFGYIILDLEQGS